MTARPVLSFAADEVALAALQARVELPQCHVCDDPLDGKPATSGLLLWSRGEELRVEEPPLCPACAGSLRIGALARARFEDESH